MKVTSYKICLLLSEFRKHYSEGPETHNFYSLQNMS